MTLDEIVLHNFGVYEGRQSIRLSPLSKSKPVVLIGGLNGGGKTTLLDAISLTLYGRRARCSNRGTLAYDDYLRRSVHRGVSTGEGAATEIQFRQYSEGVEHTYRIHRSWAANSDRVTERVEVIKDGILDRLLTERWAEFVEEIVPFGVSSLFFFDGEKIEEFADTDRSAQLLSGAIHSLLGLDLADRLGADLIVLENQKERALKTDTERKQIDEIESEIEETEQQLYDLAAEQGKVQNDIDRRKKESRQIEGRIRHEGGDLFEQREALEAERDAVFKELEKTEEHLRECAAGALPLLLVTSLLDSVEQRDRLEQDATDAEALGDILADRDAKLLDEIGKTRASKSVLVSLKGFLDEDRKQRSSSAKVVRYLNLSNEARVILRDLRRRDLPEAKAGAGELVASTQKLRASVEDLDRKLSSVPHEDAIAFLLQERKRIGEQIDQARGRLSGLAGQYSQVKRRWEQKSHKRITLLEKSIEVQFEQEDISRVIFHSREVRRTLEAFRAQMVERHATKISQLVLDSFKQLLRKNTLISDLKIDPQQFSIELTGANGTLISPDRLSAGERQLLAVSLLWGLARAAGRPLPTVIDTPLGRLDASHRSNLIERYFPYASHQVLLLSTDKEIDEESYERLKPVVGLAYKLHFDDRAGTTTIRPGYFW